MRHQYWQVLDEAQLEAKRNELVATISEMLFIGKEDADNLLRHYGWKSKKLQSDWFSDSEKVRSTCGLTAEEDRPKVQLVDGNQVQCSTAFCDVVPLDEAYALNCGHWVSSAICKQSLHRPHRQRLTHRH